jgi:hypothetical protein
MLVSQARAGSFGGEFSANSCRTLSTLDGDSGESVVVGDERSAVALGDTEVDP